MIVSEKQLLRARVAETLRAMTDAERAARSAVIAAHLADYSGMIFGFVPMRSEPDWLPRGAKQRVAVPRVEGDRLVFHRVEGLWELARGPFGAREPAADETTRVEAGEAEIVLVPGVAFDREGTRLGRGRGFYDRFLADPALAARRIAICFACQIVERVPVEPHDAEVDALLTEDGWIEARSSGRGRG
ncbi:MAG: 5-formyltetrahydrofolate cyclo-ligase [Terrimicrobiaceae bacterium]|nr:5-formyltetrahydrofolate cyclo-ligase [Terrimicrobiaceae bacterium]